MRIRGWTRAGLVVFAIAVSSPMLGRPAAAEQRGYLVTVVGRVVSVDRARAKIVLRHGMLETTRAGDEVCLVPRRLLRYLRPGMDVTATADTRQRPWRLTQVQHFHADEHVRPGETPRVAETREGRRRND